MNDPADPAPDSSHDALTPARLAQLLDLDAPASWSQADALAALRHQLAAPLLPDLALAPGAELDRLCPRAFAHPTFLDALTAPAPNLELLHAIKHWARHLRTDPASPLAGTPATVLYYAAIAAARLRLGQSITTLSDAQLRAGLLWAAAIPGTQPLAELFAAALRVLAAH